MVMIIPNKANIPKIMLGFFQKGLGNNTGESSPESTKAAQ